ncbi:hypothetical protein H5392_01995 [Tessaracoccus sp. MC1865]|uniref:sensory rhodopsin transducer n=1 Tax=Tessaracoccus sp. MC1865 TaxID=2760310 RepID=UPI001601CC6A|nr:sensory rhodopsin transducer [Tessaracoccus sp. MC1865]MBB1482630.1 hypothetical protein [Tessaracoccus sp. MC1865]QTO37919.1 hypothetical protein J7D54_02095 [Tessaracoccus sp. MC1865]
MAGKKTWYFPDGELPPPGDGDPQGHESIIILNPNSEEARVEVALYWADKAPDRFTVDVEPERVRCLRTNVTTDMGGFELPREVQYGIRLTSDVGIVAQYGRLDVRQPNMAFYTTPGYHED